MKNYSKKHSPFVLVIVHDAGGAEVIAAHIHKNTKHTTFINYVAGPAERIFRREHIPYHRILSTKKDISNVVQKHHNAKYILLGTGWMTKIEFNALAKAKKIGMKTVVYIDSWINYRERFGYPKKNWQKNLPDELWVGDKYAFSIAERYFKNITIHLIPNQYIKNIVTRYRARRRVVSNPDSILFMSGIVSVEENLLKEILIRLSNCSKPQILRITFHPTDNRRRYDSIIKRYRGNTKIQKSKGNDIVEDILHAQVVIGTETMAMALAVFVGIKTISVIPVGQKQILPFPNIIRAHSPIVAAHLI